MTRKAVVWSKRARLTTSQPSPPTLASDNTAPSPTTVYTSSPPPPPPSTPPPGAASTPALPPVSLPPPADAEHLVTLPDVVFRQLFSNLQCKTCEGDISVTVKSHGSGSQVELQCPCRVLTTVAPPVPGVKMEVLEDDAKMEILEDNVKTEILDDYSTTFVDIGPY
ncbi:hypothetical protein GWK47_026920 [Chionoecetes opilio]|uniref:Uncharacterized protein n=1 Tax=Chionoecetes opilio TaxID=41210 RepID=A0A8J8WML3_CHIOP|nr:hypothetical protein GWK47_026920 [Chionoecetes opilio]